MSYGIYLWHYPIVRYLRAQLDWPWVLLIGLPLSALLAMLSFYTIERWALSLRDKPAGKTKPARVAAPGGYTTT